MARNVVRAKKKTKQTRNSVFFFFVGELLLDPRLFIIQVPEELVQAVGLVELSATTGGHALDLSEAAVDGVTFLLHLRGVEGVAGHQAVSLAIQVLQAIL